MKPTWAVCWEGRSFAPAGALRLHLGLEAGQTATHCWLRGAALDEALARELPQIPGAHRFEVLPSGELIPHGKRVPRGRLPEILWLPLANLWPFQPQLAATPAGLPEPLPFLLRPAESERPANALVLLFADLAAWVETASRVRLNRLEWTLCGDGRALVLGEPLPPLAGQFYYETQRVLTPCGWEWSPVAEPALVAETLQLRPQEYALCGPEPSLERIPPGAFVQLSRSGVRAAGGSFAAP